MHGEPHKFSYRKYSLASYHVLLPFFSLLFLLPLPVSFTKLGVQKKKDPSDVVIPVQRRHHHLSSSPQHHNPKVVVDVVQQRTLAPALTAIISSPPKQNTVHQSRSPKPHSFRFKALVWFVWFSSSFYLKLLSPSCQLIRRSTMKKPTAPPQHGIKGGKYCI